MDDERGVELIRYESLPVPKQKKTINYEMLLGKRKGKKKIKHRRMKRNISFFAITRGKKLKSHFRPHNMQPRITSRWISGHSGKTTTVTSTQEAPEKRKPMA